MALSLSLRDTASSSSSPSSSFGLTLSADVFPSAPLRLLPSPPLPLLLLPPALECLLAESDVVAGVAD